MEAYKIIKKPLLTEKSYAGIANKVYTFVVDKKATKVDVKIAVEQAFGVKLENNRAFLQGVVSRKKQVVPQLTEVFN